jgi:hypothetical protein
VDFRLRSSLKRNDSSHRCTLELIDTVIAQAPDYTNPFGEVEFAMLRIKAPVKSAIIDLYSPPRVEFLSISTRYGLLCPPGTIRNTHYGPYIGEFRPDDEEAPVYDGDSLLCISCVIEARFEEALIHYCLAVVPAQEPGRYVRVGLAFLYEMYEREATSPWGDATPDETRILELI